MKLSPGWFFLIFVVLGWAYYMVARILMEGSIFESMRRAVKRRADESWFFRKVEMMLGCLMCTATQSSIWTLGTTTFFLGTHYGLPETVVSSIVGRPAELHTLARLVLMAMASFAISLAVSGEAWTIKNLFEFNRQKYLDLEKAGRERESELLGKIRDMEFSGKKMADYEFDLSSEE